MRPGQGGQPRSFRGSERHLQVAVPVGGMRVRRDPLSGRSAPGPLVCKVGMLLLCGPGSPCHMLKARPERREGPPLSKVPRETAISRPEVALARSAGPQPRASRVLPTPLSPEGAATRAPAPCALVAHLWVGCTCRELRAPRWVTWPHAASHAACRGRSS